MGGAVKAPWARPRWGSLGGGSPSCGPLGLGFSAAAAHPAAPWVRVCGGCGPPPTAKRPVRSRRGMSAGICMRSNGRSLGLLGHERHPLWPRAQGSKSFALPGCLALPLAPRRSLGLTPNPKPALVAGGAGAGRAAADGPRQLGAGHKPGGLRALGLRRPEPGGGRGGSVVGLLSLCLGCGAFGAAFGGRARLAQLVRLPRRPRA